ncbi:uridine kinase [Paenibacillus hemerocallicola]|uniref:Uridine kinase n=1 Tax=Paenibacillus hemerocallicola TaxID=1172614 RepID=A0A5C4TGQ9_9BACL|nr:uridine kinase [Paenibacillus hemerocallicola]TNJ68261.1 uridine kinase [Paenibacillus hemerocallicola]
MLMIGIAGGTGSGKTTVAERLVAALGEERVAFLSQDSYYADNRHLTMEDRERINYDHPDSVDGDLLLDHLRLLRSRQPIDMPVYDFSTHSRVERTIRVQSKRVVIVEGILLFADPLIRQELDIKVFVDTDADVRVLRRLSRDIQERGRTVESVFAQYLNTVKPMHDAFVEPSKRYADLIIPEGGRNDIAIGLLTSRIQSYLSQG